MLINKYPSETTNQMDREMRAPINITLQVSDKKISLSAIILILASLLFIPLIAPLFHPGPPINSDIGVHYSAIKCIYDSGQWSVPTAWCTHGQAGLARFQRYGVVHAYLTLLLALFLPFEIAFKVMMVLGFLILPIVAYFFLRRFGYPLAGAVAYALLLLEPGGQMWGGYGLHFVITGFINSTATGLSLLTIMCIIWMIEKPTQKRIATTSLVTAIYFLTHPGSAMWLPIAGIPILILYRTELRQNWKALVLYVLIFIGLISFWLLPAVAKSEYFNPPGIGGQIISENNIASALIKLGTSQLRFIVLMIISVMILSFNKRKEMRLISWIPISVIAVMALAYFFPNFIYFSYFTLDRVMYELRTYGVLCVVMLFFGGLKTKATRRQLIIAAIGAVLITFFLYKFYMIDLSLSDQIHTGKEVETILVPIYKLMDGAQGRIIAENTYFHANHALNLTQPWALSAAYSDKEFLGNSDFWYTKDDYSLMYDNHMFGRNVSKISNLEFQQILWKMNVQYVWAYSPWLINRLNGVIPVQFDLLSGLKNGAIYETPWDHSYLAFPNGTLAQTSYTTLQASTKASSEKGGVLFFKVREWPNWKATIDGKPLAIKKGAMGLMEVDVPAGKHTIRFDYGLIRVDWIGYLVTLIAAIATGWWVYANTKIPEKPVPQ